MYSNRRDRDLRLFGAVEQADGSYKTKSGRIKWFNKEGEYHREDGPAIIRQDGNPFGRVSWCLNDVTYEFDEWCIKLNISDEDAMMLRLQYG
tara:strand:- start:275 stop:550 length:276 start_codon:yes stop_codon:yes gene_type:complete